MEEAITELSTKIKKSDGTSESEEKEDSGDAIESLISNHKKKKVVKHHSSLATKAKIPKSDSKKHFEHELKIVPELDKDELTEQQILINKVNVLE